MTSSQPRVRRNEWGSLLVPPLGCQDGTWSPHLNVSIVMPAYGAHLTLPYVLAGLAAQTYPSHLVELIVVDDGAHSGQEPLQLPEIRPDNARIVQVEQGWGRANACHIGATLAEGEVIHWLDADMVPGREHVEAQLRWHHEIDYAVALGHKWFVDPAPLEGVDPADVRDAVAADRLDRYFPAEVLEPHEWVERYYAQYDDLRTIGPRACRLNIGATASLRRDLYFDSGGMDTSLKLGEDIALGYRLGEAGAVFIADREARSWHLGRSHVLRRRDEVNDYNEPFLADRLPELRNKRRAGRQYAVPYLEVVLDSTGQPHSSVVATVDALLGGSLPDLVVTLVGPWSELDDIRIHPLDDPRIEARLVRASFAGDPRVRLVESAPEGRCPAMFRLTLANSDWAPTHKTVARLLHYLERTHQGLVVVRMPDGSAARIERTAAISRAAHVMKSGEFLDDVIDELFGAHTFEAAEVGFWPSLEVHRSRLQGTAGKAEDPVAAWDHDDVPIAPSQPAAPTGPGTGPALAEHPVAPGPPSIVNAARVRVASLLGRR
ncbi:glycosyltransferase family 2 protein [Nocardioides agariphilus]|jgi:glycosyltransferase involved in cell wall biosynthesis|uniref:Glycosyltransferase family 2 protein n=1 Tax=Nocardioides agariphilus TaxID=433664 RepID=A0A930YI42_9ACTN|nr:glycosyltransferase [Nocardioides agariphilus]MBF4767698.1 glycosyltransferase family 2 protein [Nocardioides agariphilus]